jgi:hypothetical protein
MRKEYLGDGVYVQHDGYALHLTTENGIETTNNIYLEPEVYVALVNYVKKLKSNRVEACLCHHGSVCTTACTRYHHSGCPHEHSGR